MRFIAVSLVVGAGCASRKFSNNAIKQRGWMDAPDEALPEPVRLLVYLMLRTEIRSYPVRCDHCRGPAVWDQTERCYCVFGRQQSHLPSLTRVRRRRHRLRWQKRTRWLLLRKRRQAWATSNRCRLQDRSLPSINSRGDRPCSLYKFHIDGSRSCVRPA